MIEQLKELRKGDMITIDHDGVQDLANAEDLTITDVALYEVEDGQICSLTLDQFTLLAYEVADVSRYFFYETLDEGSGKNKYCRKGEFVRQFKMPIEDKRTAFVMVEECPLVTEDESMSFCQYKSESYYDSIMVATAEDQWVIYIGIELEEQQILL